MDWLIAFGEETVSPEGDPKAMAESTIAAGHFWIWDEDGPVSMAATTPNIAGVTRVRAVYTPHSHRAKGYASACVGTVSANALADGLIPVLYTDLANPVSNSVYRRLGYRAVEEVLRYRFSCER